MIADMVMRMSGMMKNRGNQKKMTTMIDMTQTVVEIFNYISMTAKAALAKALLDGRVINIKNCFQTIGLTNAPREISRMIEKPFGVTVSRTPREGKSRYGQAVTWFDYRLNRTEYNKEGIEKMEKYVRDHEEQRNPITDNETKAIKEAGLTIRLNHQQPELFQ